MPENSADLKRNGNTFAGKLAFFLLLATIVWTTLAYGTVHQPIIALFYVFVVLVVILWAIDSLVSGTIRFDKSQLQIPIAAAAIYGFIQTIPFGSVAVPGGVETVPNTISVAPFWTRLASAHFVALFAFFASMLVFTNSVRRIKKIVQLITIFGFIFAFFAILQSFLSPDKIYGIYESKYAEPFGSFVNRHNFAAFMEMSIALPLGLLFGGAVEKDKRLIYVTAIGLMGIALLLSGSRGGFVSIIAGVVFLVFVSTGTSGTRDKIVKGAMAVILIIVFVAGSILVGGESSLTRFAETATSDNFSTNRIQIWSVTLDVIQHHLPFGAGLGAFGVAYTPFDPNNGFERVEQAHNDYLEVVADAGVVGALIGAFFLFALFRTGLRNIKVENRYRRGVALGAFAGCFSILVHSAFDFILHISAITILFLTLLTLLVVSGREYSDDVKLVPLGRKTKRKKASVTSLEERRR
ncbi:MAG: O-antigen ligase domain-containing protein [Acidobacteria bacterium]|nr:MAG: O-antigen ligase domain-containing protein [Acidobacteriota bacterium]REK01848.1 MAG: O-antigen ligase domain-containing protein [Acidobacteriota bacterium]REK14804.1 MAG: O-antigen ligase domain-containing protein [Acidobacteriota bacterium]REK45519.1 MAG: O-antigen ligase domain-containing protein [Acidobacteriota bacterium]